MTGSGSFWRACCRFKGRCGPCRDHGRVRDGSSTGSTSAPRRAGANTYSSREARALPKARVRLPDPRQGGPGSGQAQTRARRRARVLLRPRLLRQAQRRRARLRVLQAMEGTGCPPRTNSPSSTEQAPSSTPSSPGSLKRHALAGRVGPISFSRVGTCCPWPNFNGDGVAASSSCGTVVPRRQMVFERKMLSAGGIDGHHNQRFRVDDECDGASVTESKKA